HFVLVTGKRGNQFLIADPGFSGRTTLDDYNNQFQTRGFVSDPPGDISELDFAVDDAELLITDVAGKHTGFDPSSGNVVEAIPGSVYYRDALEDDVTGAPPAHSAGILQIFQPSQGPYSIAIIGLKPGTSTLSVRAFSQDGTAQPPIA